MTKQKKPPAKKAVAKKKALGPNSRAKIRKYCQVVKVPNQLGCVLVYGKHQYRLNRDLKDLTDEECDRTLAKLNKHFGVEKAAAAGKRTPAKRKAVITTDPKPCECGCRVQTRPGSRFLPGHDAKLKSKLMIQMKRGTPAAKKELKARGWIK